MPPAAELVRSGDEGSRPRLGSNDVTERRPAGRLVGTVRHGGHRRGQAGLSAGYHLRGRAVVRDPRRQRADRRRWRRRYDSLRLFTPARYVGLPGGRFPGKARPRRRRTRWPTTSRRTRRGSSCPCEPASVSTASRRDGEPYIVSAGRARFEADNVIVATGAHREPRVPAMATELDPSIVQLHSSEYRNQSQLRARRCARRRRGNSGGDIALESVTSHPTWLSGPTAATSRSTSTHGWRRTSPCGSSFSSGSTC